MNGQEEGKESEKLCNYSLNLNIYISKVENFDVRQCTMEKKKLKRKTTTPN